jgi:ketosteroid isomerase-like protein
MNFFYSKSYFSGLKILYLFLILNILTAPPIFAQSTDEALVAQALERFKQAMVLPDSLVLSGLASDDLVYVHSSGTVRNKQGFIDEFMKRWTNFTKVEIRDQTIKITGDNAIVRHRLIADAQNPGYPSVVDIIILMVWRKEGGDWKMLARQAASTPINKVDQVTLSSLLLHQD